MESLTHIALRLQEAVPRCRPCPDDVKTSCRQIGPHSERHSINDAAAVQDKIHSCCAIRQTLLAAPPIAPRRRCSMVCGHDGLRWRKSRGLKPGNTAWRRGHGSQPARRRDICLARLLHAIERRCDREKINIPKRKLEDETAQECENFIWPLRLYGWGMSSYGRKNLKILTYLTL